MRHYFTKISCLISNSFITCEGLSLKSVKMIITLKTLQQQTFKIDIGDEELVKALKEKIEKEKGTETFPAAGQKLIYAGKILDDEKPVSFYKIEEKNFVVVMVTKPKPASAPAPAAGATATPPTTESSPAPTQATQPALAKEEPKTEEKLEPPSNTTSTTDTTASESSSATTTTASETSQQSVSETSVTSEMSTTSAESALVTGQMYEEAVKQMIDMGFPREQVQRAMRASFNNPDRAVEYLFNGIPEMPRDEPSPAASQPTGTPAPTGGTPAAGAQSAGTGEQQATTQPTQPATQPAAGGTGTASPGTLSGPPPGARLSGEETLAFLRNQPQFQQMRTLLQQNPALLPELLQQIGRSNPQLLQLISQNQEQFIAMLNETGGESGGGGGGAPGQGPREGVIHVTQEEKEAIDRLKALGFPEGICIQAYFACEKNEELAANYLLSHGFDDEDS